MSRRKSVDVSDLVDHNLRLVKKQLVALEKEIDTKGYDEDLGGKLNALTRSIAVITAEERKRDSHAEKAVKKMTDEERVELVKHFIADLAPDSRLEIRRLLDELEGGSVL